MKTLKLVVLALGLLAIGCGGGDDGGGPAGPGNGGGGGGGGGNSFTATIDGTNWSSDKNLIQVSGSATPTRQGLLIISGYSVAAKRNVTLDLSYIVGPATQPLGVNTGSNPGGAAGVTINTDLWLTPLNGKAGFVTITARTDKRIAGTFNFTAEPAVPGTLPATRTVTNGKFDITVDAGLPPLPTGVGSTTTANLGGTPWNGATIVGIRTGPSVFGVTSSTTEYQMSFTTGVPISSTGAYGIGTQMILQVLEIGSGNAWAAVGGPDAGTLNITSLDANRVIGNFTATLPRVGGGTALTITSGTLNAYLQTE